MSSTSQGSGGAEADEGVLHFEHTFQARLLVPTSTSTTTPAAAAAAEGPSSSSSSSAAEAEAAALLSLPMPRGAGPGAPPTHHVYPPGHPHHLHAHQQGPPLHFQAPGAAEAAAAYKEVPVRITLVGEKMTVEEDGVALNRAKPPPVLEASFAEVRTVFGGVG